MTPDTVAGTCAVQKAEEGGDDEHRRFDLKRLVDERQNQQGGETKGQPHGDAAERQAKDAHDNLHRRLNVPTNDADRLGVGEKGLPQHKRAAVIEEGLPLN
eukprot:TRINITY_DN1854_c0_g1_i1.p5 TRINITY_DN1854_c0_g1~~TRINITY_DN1854_c0_g1_i1.p5  ORF type:complete len:101 (+),score=15.44 TRINITY_DN1854_c0_g1_i1:552-854(+)